MLTVVSTPVSTAARYGDPVHPEGDLAAMREIWLSLAPESVLLLGLPTCYRDVLFFPWHRIYGPRRLARMLRGFRMLARVWDGVLVLGGLEAHARVERDRVLAAGGRARQKRVPRRGPPP